MQITQMHAQLTELSREYERVAKIGPQLQAVLQQITASQAHLNNLKYNIERQIEVFEQISPCKEDNL